MKRRIALQALSMGAVVPGWVNANTNSAYKADVILLGQTADFSASRAAISQAYSAGAQLVFEQTNAVGGVFGRPIQVVTLDDAYNIEKAQTNAKKLVEESQIFALVHGVGTAIAEKVIPYTELLGVPHIHPLTGADHVRPPLLPSKNTFFLRASYGREIERIVSQLKTLGITQVALVHEDESFGKAIRALLEKAMQAQGMQLSAVGVLPFNAPDNVNAAVQTVIKKQPTAIIVGSAGASVDNFIAAYHASGERAQYYCLSICNIERLYKTLGPRSAGIVVTQVMPSLEKSSMAVVRDYQAMALDKKLAPSGFGLEGFISARIIVQALTKSGPQLSRQKFAAALANPVSRQLGGFPIQRAANSRTGSPFVDLALLNTNGKLIF